jgi:hypothetical protein
MVPVSLTVGALGSSAELVMVVAEIDLPIMACNELRSLEAAVFSPTDTIRSAIRVASACTSAKREDNARITERNLGLQAKMARK